MKKNTNWIKNLIMVIIFISVITQVNIAINNGIKLAVAKYKENKINEEKMLCPPDICTVNNEEKQVRWNLKSLNYRRYHR